VHIETSIVTLTATWAYRVVRPEVLQPGLATAFAVLKVGIHELFSSGHAIIR
jgi:hypothetical protein